VDLRRLRPGASGILGQTAEHAERDRRHRDDQLQRPGEVLDQAHREVDQLKKQIEDEQEQVRRQRAPNEALVPYLRPLVKERARRAGRKDILDALPVTSDLDTFRRWLEELA
jgi:hypothetical protein